MEEVWKDISGFLGVYQVSNLGRVRSLDRKIYTQNGKLHSSTKGKVIKHFKTKEGYHRVQLCLNGRNKKFLVHRLVAQSFVPNDTLKLEVNHKNANKDDNTASNLEWVTRKENVKHSFELNLVYRDKGEQRYNAKLNDDIVREMRKLYNTGDYKISFIAKLFNVDRKTASCAIKKVTWKHVL